MFLGRWHGALVAVKVLRSDWGSEAARSLREEAHLLCSLRFPNVLTFLTAYVNIIPVRAGERRRPARVPGARGSSYLVTSSVHSVLHTWCAACCCGVAVRG